LSGSISLQNKDSKIDKSSEVKRRWIISDKPQKKKLKKKNEKESFSARSWQQFLAITIDYKITVRFFFFFSLCIQILFFVSSLCNRLLIPLECLSC